MTPLPLFLVDSFADRPFTGNPAAVVPVDDWPADAVLQQIAAELKQSETAFYGRDGDRLLLRWFTPTVEVDLCGHATLAAGVVALRQDTREGASVTFETCSGPLVVHRTGEGFRIELPRRDTAPVEAPAGLAEALGCSTELVLGGREAVVVVEDAAIVRALNPDLRALAALPDLFAACVTAPGTGADGNVDFVSRFFAPAQGIDEDPVTGSAHCTLAPYWGKRLGTTELRARQVGPRGGDLLCRVGEQRVELEGKARLVFEGRFLLD